MRRLLMSLVRGECRFAVWGLAAVALGMLAGCTPIVITSSPDTFPVPAIVSEGITGQGNIVVANAYRSDTPVKLYSGMRDWEGDLRQYTGTAIVLLSNELTRKGMKIGSPASKSVTLRVFDVTSTGPGWGYTSTVSLEARFADGTTTVVRSENTSPADGWRAMDGAIMRAVSRLLGDERFVAYVNR
jgi:hypothetical protein